MKLALFDLDGTLLPTDSDHAFGEFLVGIGWADAASHRQLAFMVGNRDFLVGSALLREAGLMALPDPTVLSAWGQPVLLSHGDALCLSDTPYQAFRREVRSPANVWNLTSICSFTHMRMASLFSVLMLPKPAGAAMIESVA